MREILIAGGLALFFSLFGTPVLIKMLVRRGYGQFIRDDGPSSHHTKRGTPTMGGLIIIFSVVASYLIAHLISGNDISVSVLLIIGLVASVQMLRDPLAMSNYTSYDQMLKNRLWTHPADPKIINGRTEKNCRFVSGPSLIDQERFIRSTETDGVYVCRER
jgi:phospho-N-acetylmuramoyl-pentapeptide-transferase